MQRELNAVEVARIKAELGISAGGVECASITHRGLRTQQRVPDGWYKLQLQLLRDRLSRPVR